jgi:hypothetical protein
MNSRHRPLKVYKGHTSSTCTRKDIIYIKQSNKLNKLIKESTRQHDNLQYISRKQKNIITPKADINTEIQAK